MLERKEWKRCLGEVLSFYRVVQRRGEWVEGCKEGRVLVEEEGRLRERRERARREYEAKVMVMKMEEGERRVRELEGALEEREEEVRVLKEERVEREEEGKAREVCILFS